VHFPAFVGIGQLTALVTPALIVAAVCTLQTSVVLRSFPSESDVADDVSPDFTAIGVGSIFAALCGAFPVNASPPRTALAQGAGGRSQASGLVAVAAIVVVVAFLARFAAFVPEGALAGVLIFVGLRVFRLSDMIKIARYSRREINLVIVGALLVIVLPIQTGMLLAIMLSLAHGVSLVMWPASTQLFQVRGTTVWWPPTGERDVVDVPGIVVFEPAAPVNFTNAEYIAERLQACVTKAKAPVKLLVIEGSAISDIDYTGSQKLQDTIAELRSRGTDVALARLIVPHAQRAAERSGLISLLGSDHVFKSVQEAIAALDAGAGK
jgi:MFS superfamily sulfate permease-like transporter